MNALVPPWPREIPRRFFPIAHLKHSPELTPGTILDLIALQHARGLERQLGDFRAGGYSPGWTECLWSIGTNATAYASSTSEVSLLTGLTSQPTIPAPFLDQNNRAVGKVLTFIAKGVLSTTSTPTIIFQCRLSSTQGVSQLGGASVGVSAAITTASGVTNKMWELRLDLTCTVSGQGTANTTLSGAGWVMSPGGFAAPYIYALEPTTPDTATWTQTFDASLTYFFNLSATWGTNSASNTITLKNLYCPSWN